MDWTLALAEAEKARAAQVAAREALRALKEEERTERRRALTAERNRRWRERDKGKADEGKRGRGEEEKKAAKQAKAAKAPKDREVAGNVDLKVVAFLPGFAGVGQGIPPELAVLEGFAEAWAGWMERVRMAGTKANPLPAGKRADILAALREQPGRALEAARKGSAKRWRSFEWAWMEATRPSEGAKSEAEISEAERARRQQEGWV